MFICTGWRIDVDVDDFESVVFILVASLEAIRGLMRWPDPAGLALSVRYSLEFYQKNNVILHARVKNGHVSLLIPNNLSNT
jgi:hypothetical protein